MLTLRRLAGLFAVLTLALLAPASASAGGAHLLRLYKVEKHVDLEGEDSHYDLSCLGTDIAIDGMYRIDAVDQDTEFTRPQLLESVWQIAAYPLGDSSYRFQFTPTLGGDVQIKLWLTCLGRQTNPSQSHVHTFSLSQQQVPDAHLGAPTGSVAFDHAAGDCPAGELAVQPGWRLDSPSGGQLVPYRGYTTANSRNRYFAFVLGQASDLTVFRSCLTLRSSLTNSHRHRIVVLLKPNFGGSLRHLAVHDNRWDEDLACGEHYKAMLGNWWIDDPFHVWWFGMEPRPKLRTYWFLNDGGGSDTVYLANFCFKDKTT
jgi:hypothetical protein